MADDDLDTNEQLDDGFTGASKSTRGRGGAVYKPLKKRSNGCCSPGSCKCCRLRKGTRCFRFTLLFMATFIFFTGYFQFDLPAITVDYLIEKLKIDITVFSYLFVGYAVANTIMPLLAGPFFARIGKWRGVVVIASTITTGICIVFLGVFFNSFPVMVLGRFVYGMGGESAFVGIDILVTKWFQGHEIAFAYGIVQAMGQAGSATALYSVPHLVRFFGGKIEWVFLISFCLSATDLTMILIARVLEMTAYTARPTKSDSEKASLLGDSKRAGTEDALISKGGGYGSGAVAPAAVTEAPHDDEHVEGIMNDTDIESDELKLRLADNLRWIKCIPPLYNALMFLGFGHLGNMNWRFWCVMISIITYSSSFYTFLAFSPKWLISVYHLDDEEAGQRAGLIAVFSMVVSPVSGIIMDKVGGQPYVAFLAMMSSCAWFSVMGFTKLNPFICIAAAGMSYALLPSSLYALLPEHIDPESFTTVYAILNSGINLVFTCILVAAGQILGEGDEGSLGAVGHSQLLGGGRGSWPSVLGIAGYGARSLQDPVDPENALEAENFHWVFTMFIILTGIGVITTGMLALDACRRGTGGPLKRRLH